MCKLLIYLLHFFQIYTKFIDWCEFLSSYFLYDWKDFNITMAVNVFKMIQCVAK